MDYIFDVKNVIAKTRHIDVQWSIEEFGEPKWKNHRWHFQGRQYRSLRQIKSTRWYKAEKSIVKNLTCEIQKEIDTNILKTILSLAK